MASKYLNYDGVKYLWQQIEAELATRDDDISDITDLIGTVAAGHTVMGDLAAAQTAAQDYTNTQIAGLTPTSTGTGYYVTAVDQTNGRIAVTKEAKGVVMANSTGLVDGDTVNAAINGAINVINTLNPIEGDYLVSISQSKGRISGTAGTKGTIAAGQTGLVDGDTVYTYVQQEVSGLSGAMHFKGTATNEITDGGSQAPKADVTPEAGDVYLYGNKEFIWIPVDGSTAAHWEELGDEGSYALKTRSITGTDGLTGGGDLTADRTISHAVPTGAAAGNKEITADSTGHLYVQSGVTTDKFGHTTAIASKDIYTSVETIAQAKVDAAAGNYATAAQGALAATALQPADIAALTNTEILAAINEAKGE